MLYNLPMPPVVPTPPATGVPPQVEEYLRENGWTQSYANNTYYYSANNIQGFFTWEQAVVYTFLLPVVKITK